MSDLTDDQKRTLVSRNGRGQIFTDDQGGEWVPKESLEQLLTSFKNLRPGDEVRIPLAGGDWARVNFPKSMTEEEWTYVHNVLEVMKPALVSPDPLHDFEQGLRGSRKRGNASHG